MKAHFDTLISLYGHVTVLSLVEKTGKEAILGDGFTKIIDLLGDDKNIRFVLLLLSVMGVCSDGLTFVLDV